MRRMPPRFTLVVTMGLFGLWGCGVNADRPKMAKVSGKVTYKGKALDKGEIIFTPEKNKGGPSGHVATGKIESDGSFTLTTFDTDDGAVLGQHVVTVNVPTQDIKELNKPRADGSIPYILPKPGIPEKYIRVDSSPLRYTVDDKPTNAFEIELKD
jgi:hypothetical protein